MGYWHLICWALRERAPMPMREGEALLWAGALDNKGPRGERGGRVRPGPLGANVKEARAWFAQRLTQTPGVLVVDEDSAPDVPLTVRIRLANECPILDQHFNRFLVDQENPDGQPVSDPLSRWLIDGQLGCGHYTRWDPPPPDDWASARRNVARLVRSYIDSPANKRSARPIDTEAQVLRRHEDHEVVATWRAIKDTYIPKDNSETVWVSDATLETAIEWLNESDDPGIVWCGSVAFAKALSDRGKLPYYGPKGKDQRGRGLHNATVENIVASWKANKKIFNLQPWARQLIVMPPQSAKWLEQIFGRCHRSGQKNPVVIDFLVTSGGTLDSFEIAVSEASFSRETITLTQKITRATIERATPTITPANKFRWATR